MNFSSQSFGIHGSICAHVEAQAIDGKNCDVWEFESGNVKLLPNIAIHLWLHDLQFSKCYCYMIRIMDMYLKSKSINWRSTIAYRAIESLTHRIVAYSSFARFISEDLLSTCIIASNYSASDASASTRKLSTVTVHGSWKLESIVLKLWYNI